MTPSFIYVIEHSTLDYFKIGVARNPYSRLAQLQVANPFPLTLHALVRTDTDNEKRIESEIHYVLAGVHYHGEWFHCTGKEIVNALNELGLKWEMTSIKVFRHDRKNQLRKAVDWLIANDTEKMTLREMAKTAKVSLGTMFSAKKMFVQRTVQPGV